MSDDNDPANKRIFGFAREQIAFVGGPLFANVLLIAYYYGETYTLDVPAFLVSVTPADVLTWATAGFMIAGAIAYFPLWVFVTRERASLKSGKRTRTFSLKAPSLYWTLLLSVATIIIAFSTGSFKAGLPRSKWPIVVDRRTENSTCVIVAKFGDNFIATDFPEFSQVFSSDMTHTFTIYHADHLPALRLGTPGAFKPTAKNPTSCPPAEREKDE